MVIKKMEREKKMKLEFSLASTNMRLRVHHSVAPSVFANFKQSLSRSKRASHLTSFIRSFVRRRRRRSHFNYQSINSRGNYSRFHCGTYLISLSLNRSHAQQSPNIHALVLFSVLSSILLEWLAFWHSPKNIHTHRLWAKLQFHTAMKKAKMAHEESKVKVSAMNLHRDYMRIKCCADSVCFFFGRTHVHIKTKASRNNSKKLAVKRNSSGFHLRWFAASLVPRNIGQWSHLTWNITINVIHCARNTHERRRKNYDRWNAHDYYFFLLLDPGVCLSLYLFNGLNGSTESKSTRKSRTSLTQRFII